MFVVSLQCHLHIFMVNNLQPLIYKPVKRFQMDVFMSSIQAYKARKQEGTLVSKVHKQGALGTSSQASLHQLV